MLPGNSLDYEEKRRFPIAFIAGAVIVLIIGAALALVIKKSQPKGVAAAKNLPFGPAEQAYAPHIQFQAIQMAHSTNFLNQEFTYVAGTMTNDGTRDIKAMDVSIEFRDPFKQTILKDSEHLIGPDTAPLTAGQKGTFSVSVEHLPAEWNHEYPIITVTGLVLQ